MRWSIHSLAAVLALFGCGPTNFAEEPVFFVAPNGTRILERDATFLGMSDQPRPKGYWCGVGQYQTERLGDPGKIRIYPLVRIAPSVSNGEVFVATLQNHVGTEQAFLPSKQALAPTSEASNDKNQYRTATEALQDCR